MGYSVEKAVASDLPRIESMLKEARLPINGVAPLIESFSVVREEGQIVAAGVIEPLQGVGLLRSVVVDPEWQGKGLGRVLVESLSLGASQDLYLLTESAPEFFARLGFEHVERSHAPETVRQSEEYCSICAESAALMRRSVDPNND
ncbi:MAG: GNAT family N-acetyltransferase [Bacteroidota bacterium]|nr:GNAT family N-acetyltransferase [Bacteroidota bacterium]